MILSQRIERWCSTKSGIRSEYLLTGPTLEPWHPDSLTQAWARDAARATADGLAEAPMRLHDCRHWNATQLVANNVDLNTVADRLGHSTPAFTLAVYGHSDAERDRAAASKLGAASASNDNSRGSRWTLLGQSSRGQRPRVTKTTL